MPNLPTHPLVNDDSAELLLCDLKGYLAVCQQLVGAHDEGAVHHFEDVEHGMFILLDACREGVQVLAHMDAIGKVAKLEGKS